LSEVAEEFCVTSKEKLKTEVRNIKTCKDQDENKGTEKEN
jgi:hypothetical protein